jgi:hypothetical protein
MPPQFVLPAGKYLEHWVFVQAVDMNMTLAKADFDAAMELFSANNSQELLRNHSLAFNKVNI